MAGALVGYEFLRERLATDAFPLSRPAAIFPVTKVTAMADYLQVPGPVAPATDDPRRHALQAQAVVQLVQEMLPHLLPLQTNNPAHPELIGI